LRVPRLSEHYELAALYYFGLGQDVQVWFTLMAAWAYEDEDEKEYRAYQGEQIEFDMPPAPAYSKGSKSPSRKSSGASSCANPSLSLFKVA
jgi:hypothetical protein